MEQWQEWNRPVYTNFVDFEKAFDSVHIDMCSQALWNLVYSQALWNPTMIVSIINLLYGDFRSKVICGQ